VARITVGEAQAWVESSKLAIASLDTNLLPQIELQVLSRLATQYDVSTWSNEATTPKMVRSVIAMLYVAWYYDRQYSEDQEAGNDYAAMLRAQAESLTVGLLDGSVEPDPDNPSATDEPGGPSFYPTDASSALEPTDDDPSLGGEQFSMGMRW
jgi:hypothetical protein